MKSISWLHLTDLHAGTPEHDRLWGNVREKFFADLKKLSKRTKSLDLVFFTGDLAFQGSKQDFDIVDNVLQGVWKELDQLGHNPVLIAVPGNHDLQRPTKKSRSDLFALRQWHSNKDLQIEFWKTEKNSCRKMVVEAFKPYSTWYGNWRKTHKHEWYNSWQEGIMPGDFSMTVEKDYIRLGIVGLNSAFLQLENENFQGKP